jgi:Cu/Ag efflux protein CusF
MRPHTIPKLALAAAALLAGWLPAVTHAQDAAATTTSVEKGPGKAHAVETTKATATVVGVDAARRVVSLKTSQGRVVEMEAGPEVRNFDQIRVGDKVLAEYVRSLSLELKKNGAPTRGNTAQARTDRAPAGSKPAGTVSHEVTLLADVVKVDAKGRSVTLRGPKGNLVDLDISDPEQLKAIKVGDKVEAIYTEAVAVRLESAGKAP